MRWLFFIVLLINPVQLSAAQAAISFQQNRSQLQQPAAERSQEMAEAAQLTATVMSLYRAGKYDEALPLAKRVLELAEHAANPDDESIQQALINLGEIHLARGKPDDARQMFERALRGYEKTLVPLDVRISRVLDSLALAYYGLGRSGETEKAYQRSLKIREEKLGLENLEVANSVNRLAQFYQYEGEYSKAEPLYVRLVNVREQLGANDGLAEALDGYACLLRKTRHEERAEQLENQAQEILHPHEPIRAPFKLGVLSGKALSLASPAYPYLARTAHVHGTVVVSVLIDETGKVIRACAVEGPSLLMKVSESAAFRAKFSPTKVEGSPVKALGIVRYNFVNN